MVSQYGVHDAADCSNNASVACRAHEPTQCCLERTVRRQLDLDVGLVLVSAFRYNCLDFHKVRHWFLISLKTQQVRQGELKDAVDKAETLLQPLQEEG